MKLDLADLLARISSHQLEDDHGERVDVHLEVVRLVPKHLWRHVSVAARLPRQLVDLAGRHRHLAVAVDGDQRLGEAKVWLGRGWFDMVSVGQSVGWLQLVGWLIGPNPRLCQPTKSICSPPQTQPSNPTHPDDRPPAHPRP
jgi:hypothetical protein